MADQADQADVAIDAILANFPQHRPGTRPVHAPGVGVSGWFQASALAARYTSAEHLAGGRIPVTVRFSNGTGNWGEPDTAPNVRGMAVRFHLGEVETDAGGVLRSARETDLVSMTLPVFFTNTVGDFLRFNEAALPLAVPPPTPWGKVLAHLNRVAGQLKLLPDAAKATPREQAVARFADGYPPARLAVIATTLLTVPESYATCCFHAVHAFRLTAGDRTTSVRFHWEPVAGVRPAAKDVPATFLRDELDQRLRQAPVEFVLRAQLAEAGDDTSDPTVPWPQTRRRVVLGQITLDRLVADQDRGCERLDFNPTRLVPGIDLSDDETLLARRATYERSAARRRAVSAGNGAAG